MRWTYFVAALMCPIFANAAVGAKQLYANYGTAIATTALDASSSSFSVKNEVATTGGTWGLMIVWVTIIDADAACSLVTMNCTGSKNGNSTDYQLEDLTVATGVATSVAASWTRNPGTGTTRWLWRVDIEGIPDVECTFTDTGGDASDSIAVDVSFATKGS
jgi:hypothetical protein